MYLCGVDIGGTFTDCVLIGDDGEVLVGKSATTPGAFEDGVLAAIADAIEGVDGVAGGIATDIKRMVHGTTIGTNAVVERKGANVGLVTTAGHGDTIHFMRANGRVAGLTPEELMWVSRTDKPAPLVPKRRILEAIERIDRDGQEVVPLNHDRLREDLEALKDIGVEAIAICLLWSFRNPAHENRVREMVAESFPDAFVSASVDLLPRWGEYERTVATVLNCYIGPAMERYLGRLSDRLETEGLKGAPKIFRAAGGSMGLEAAARSPILTLGSGPAAGVEGCAHLARELGLANVLATDMGGTTFDVGLVVDGEPLVVEKGEISQYEYSSPRIETRSIGSGGGSLIWVDERTSSLKVGPGSAGADPGPACYGRGGKEPTVTDADLMLGRIDPDRFLGGKSRLDPKAAEDALAKVGESLGWSAVETAAGALEIVDFQMAELTRRMTVQNGRDPRDMVVFAYGGAGPLHAGVIMRELGASKSVIPIGDLGSVWSAFGAAVTGPSALAYADEVHRLPVSPPEVIVDRLRELEREANQDLDADGVTSEDRNAIWQLQMKYPLQVHVLEIPVDPQLLEEDFNERLMLAFEAEYERVFGAGTAYSEAGAEIVGLQVKVDQASPHRFDDDAAEPEPFPMKESTRRDVYWREPRRFVSTPIMHEEAMVPGAEIEGPALIELPHTSIAVDPGIHARLDRLGNVHLKAKQG